MINDPLTFWEQKASSPNWQDYILPGKSLKEFIRSGHLQAKFLADYIQSEDTVLDYGCGVGRVLKPLSKSVQQIIGVDVSCGLINKAKEYCMDVSNASLGTLDRFQEKHDIADFVYCLMVLQHNCHKNQLKIMSHIHQLLKPGGNALIQFPMKSSKVYKETKFVHKFTIDEINSLASVFDRFDIFEGNLTTYQSLLFDKKNPNEYFLMAYKKGEI